MLMAVTGIIFIGFVLVHMYGNLKAFAGHDAFNEYAHHLREIGVPLLPYEGFLWIVRAGPDRRGGRAHRRARSSCGGAPRRPARCPTS